jgi:glutamate formiminotransferase/formiminotetrahydrofolate cyclodeaminase
MPLTLSGFIDDVAAGTPAPGGGAVAALAGALAAALAEMVARLTIGKKKYATVEADMSAAAAASASLRRRLLDAVARDAAAYTAVLDAYKIDKSDPQRDQAVQTAMREAADVPLEVMRLSLDAMRLSRKVADQGNANAVIDAAVAARMGLSAIEGAGLNVRINAHSLTDADIAAHLTDTVSSLTEEARALSAEVLSLAETRAGLK